MGARRSSPLLRPLLEAWAFVTPGIAFLHQYVQLGTPDIGANSAHFGLVGSVWLAVAAVRLGAWRTLPPRGAAALATASCLALWLALVGYYAVALVGLQGWGKIITWPILKPYLAAPDDLLAYLGAPHAAVVIGALSALFLTGWFWHAVVGRNDWIGRLQRPLGAAAHLVLLACVGTGAGLLIARYVADPPTSIGEPVSLTLFPPPPAKVGEANWPQDPERLAAENQARAVLSRTRPTKRPHIILIVSDALRADRMGVYGYRRGTTPFLSRRVASSGQAWPVRAVAACAETSCGMPALLYSKYPREMVGGALGLSEALKLLGYGSFVLLTGDHTNYYGLAELYKPSDVYVDATTQDRRFVNDDRIVLDAIERLPMATADRPAFLQISLLSNHPLGVRWPSSRWYEPSGNYATWGKRKHVAKLTPEERALAGNFYDNGVRQVDAMIETILRRLESRGYLRQALVVVTSDHGEMLGEHNVLSHTVGVFQPVLDVPALVIRYGYDGQPMLRRSWASQTDIAATILSDLGVEIPATWSGVPLQSVDRRPYIEFAQGDESGVLHLESPHRGYKYWVHARTGSQFVFDLSRDPDESDNLISTLPSTVTSRWRTIVTGGASNAPGMSR